MYASQPVQKPVTAASRASAATSRPSAAPAIVQPRFGEGPLEDSRPPRAANAVGLVVLTLSSALYGAGEQTAGTAFGSLVAALALLAAATGFCTGCEAYKLAHRLTGRPFVSCPIPGASTS